MGEKEVWIIVNHLTVPSCFPAMGFPLGHFLPL
jgi:hypothetical protein